MKRIAIIFALVAVIITSAFAERPVSQNALPMNAQSFIGNFFPSSTVTYVEQDYDDFEVYLNDRTKITFWRDGSWKDVKCYAGVPTGILPPAVAASLAQSYPNVQIIEVEKKRGSYELKLANRMEVYFGENGNLIGQKFDD